jgi:hypothetical protein
LIGVGDEVIIEIPGGSGSYVARDDDAWYKRDDALSRKDGEGLLILTMGFP